MKRFLTLMLAVLLIFSVTACSSTTEPDTDTETGDDSAVVGEDVQIDGDTLLESKNARVALAYGFDKEFIIVDILGDNGSIATDYFVPVNFAYGPADTQYAGIDFRESSTEGYHYDADKALEYWDAAKEELGFSTAVVTLLNYDSESSGKIAEHIKEEWERNLPGLEVTIRPMPFAEKLQLADDGDFDINFAGWGPDYPDPMTFLDMWVTDGSYNEAGWTNADFDAEIATAKDPSTSPEDRWTAMLNAEKILLEEVPIINMYQRGGIMLKNPEVTAMYKHGFGPDYSYKWTDKPANADGKKILNLVETSDIPSMDPNNATDAVSFEMLNQTNEGLMRLTEGDQPVPGVATGVTYDEATMTYTFTLNPDAVWVKSDGTVYGPVTANDFVYSWDRLASDELGAQYAFMLDIAAISGYEAVDDYTLNVTTSAKNAYFEALMSFPVFAPINEAFVNEVGADQFGNSVETSLYNGPFYMNSWKLGAEVQIYKSPNYWDADSVLLDEVYTRVINGADNNTVVQMYLNGEIDRAGLSGENVATYRDRDDASPFGETTVFYLSLNIDNHGK